MVPRVTTEPTAMEAAAANAGAALPDEAAEDGHEEAAHQDVVGDGEGRHHVLGDDGDQDGHDAQRQDPEAVGLDVVLGVVGVVRVDVLAEPAGNERQDVGAGHGGGSDQGAGGGGHHGGNGCGEDQAADADGEQVLGDLGVDDVLAAGDVDAGQGHAVRPCRSGRRQRRRGCSRCRRWRRPSGPRRGSWR